MNLEHLRDLLAVIAAIFAVAGNVPYLVQVVRGRVQPHTYTWLVGAIVSGTVFLGMFQKGAGIGVLPIAVSEIFTILIFFFSLKYGFKEIAKTDKIFLCIALLGIVPWFVTDDPTFSVVIAVGVDVASLVPTVRKTWTHPSTEHPILYGSNVVRHILALLSLQTYNVATTLHSIAMIIANAGILAVIFRKGKVSV